MKKRIFFVAVLLLVVVLPFSVFAHSGRTDWSGGHKDNKNKSGLGGYHYHCGGYPAHLHTNGICPYTGDGISSVPSSTPQKIYATEIRVPNMPPSINVGESIQLKGSVYPSDAEDQTIFWKSDDTSVARIDSNGNLKAVGIGKTIIRAETVRGTISEYTITVHEIVAESISITGKQSEITIKESGQLSVAFIPDNTTYQNIVWKSGDESIVSIDQNGRFTALTVGKTTITAIHKELTDFFEIEVNSIEAEHLEILCINKNTHEAYEKYRFKEGSPVLLKSVISPEDVTDATVQWSVDNTEIAEVDQKGIFIGHKEGTVIVTGTASNGIATSIEIEIYESSVMVPVISCSVVVGTVLVILYFVKRNQKKGDLAGLKEE